MKNTCWRLFSYLSIDREAAQELLNEMAEGGWELELLILNLFARFRRTERTDLRYFLDWADPRQDEDPDYIHICTEAGWELKDELGYWNLYSSRPGFSPTPIQTDPELEYQRFRKKALRRSVASGIISGGILLLLSALLLALMRKNGADWGRYILELVTLDTVFSLVLLSLPLLVLAALLHLGTQIRRLRLWKQALQNGEVPSFSRRAAEVWKWINFFQAVVSLLFFLSMLFAALMNSGAQYRGVAIGAGLAGILHMTRDDTNRTRFQMGLLTAVLGVSLLLAGSFHTSFRSVFPGRFPSESLMENAIVETGRSRNSVFSLTDTPLGSQKEWTERALKENGEPEPQTFYWFKAHTWTLPCLAQQAVEKFSAGMHPVAGQEGVWCSDTGRYLLFRGSTLVEVLEYEGEPEVLFDVALAWMEKVK